MKVKTYNKLVRDNIPTIIENDGKKCNCVILDDEKYVDELNKKLIEEMNEYQEEYDINELADLQEIINAIVKSKGLTLEEFNAIREKKAKKNGAFNDRIYLIDVIEND